MNAWLIFLLVVIIGSWCLDLVVEYVNLRHASPELPQEFADVLSADSYSKSQQYLRETGRFGLIQSTFFTALLLTVIFLGILEYIDIFVRDCFDHVILRGLLFGGIVLAANLAVSLPFSWYGTFVIEERYGFNRTTVKTFITDRIKGICLGTILGGPLFALLIWFFDASELAWLWAWLAVLAFQIVMVFIAPVLIMPLFNKYEPLEEGKLKDAVLSYAKEQSFQLKGIYKADGSRRSNKANAFFTGFGKSRRIVLYDTLIDKHTTEELVAVLAHEMGHFRKKHIQKSMVLGALSIGAMLYFISILISRQPVFEAFGMTRVSVYAGLIFIGILFQPLGLLFSLIGNWFSRRFEFQADAYAASTMENGASHLIAALKRLSADNLSNLTPHPLKVFLEYSHPPVLQRIQAMRKKR